MPIVWKKCRSRFQRAIRDFRKQRKRPQFEATADSTSLEPDSDTVVQSCEIPNKTVACTNSVESIPPLTGDEYRIQPKAEFETNSSITLSGEVANSSSSDDSDSDVDYFDSSYTKKRFIKNATKRIKSELLFLKLPAEWTLELPDPKDLLHIKLIYEPTKGYYRCGRHVFEVEFSMNYPNYPPKVRCLTPVYHPNMDFQGRMSLEFLNTEHWQLNMNLELIVKAVTKLYQEPNSERAINKQAAWSLEKNRKRFTKNVFYSMLGKVVGNHKYEGCFREDIGRDAFDDIWLYNEYFNVEKMDKIN